MTEQEEFKFKRIVHINSLQALLDIISEINNVPFDEIQWMKDGKPLDVPQELKDEFKMTGLSNKDFVALEFWEKY